MRARYIGVLILGLTSLNGCMAWRPQEGGAAAAIERNHPKWARVMRQDSSRVHIYRPTVANDSLVGQSNRGRPIAIPLQEVASFSVRKFDWVPFLTLVVLTAGFVVLAGVNSGCC